MTHQISISKWHGHPLPLTATAPSFIWGDPGPPAYSTARIGKGLYWTPHNINRQSGNTPEQSWFKFRAIRENANLTEAYQCLRRRNSKAGCLRGFRVWAQEVWDLSFGGAGRRLTGIEQSLWHNSLGSVNAEVRVWKWIIVNYCLRKQTVCLGEQTAGSDKLISGNFLKQTVRLFIDVIFPRQRFPEANNYVMLILVD